MPHALHKSFDLLEGGCSLPGAHRESVECLSGRRVSRQVSKRQKNWQSMPGCKSRSRRNLLVVFLPPCLPRDSDKAQAAELRSTYASLGGTPGREHPSPQNMMRTFLDMNRRGTKPRKEQTRSAAPRTRGRGHSPNFRLDCFESQVRVVGTGSSCKAFDSPFPYLSSEPGILIAGLQTCLLMKSQLRNSIACQSCLHCSMCSGTWSMAKYLHTATASLGHDGQASSEIQFSHEYERLETVEPVPSV